MSDMVALEALRRPITVEEYNKMAEVGIIARGERVELLDGDVIVVPPHGQPHFSVVARISQRLNLRFGERVLVTTQLPIKNPQNIHQANPFEKSSFSPTMAK